ncbi:MAG: ABC transporter ATP-binding protein [Candidatus Nanopelagicales bacterium]|nr:ABC transporter ATP-binding protein [Candidatus Nanopelagicales bacterium]
MNESDPAVLRVIDATKVHGRDHVEVVALSEVNLAVAPGEMVAVMGPSGAGKSTLLNLAGGLDAPSEGYVVVEGEDLWSVSARRRAEIRRRHVGYVFQDLNLIPSLTAAENVAMPLSLDGVPWRTGRSSALAGLDEVGLPDAADRFPSELSGGEQQRVAIARSLVGHRRLILADEPTGALDSVTGDEVLALLRQRCDGGAACVLVTHEPRLAAWADRVVFLRDGRTVSEAEFRGASSDIARTRA